MDKLMRDALYAALGTLPEKQQIRMYRHYILGMSKYEIARAEGVSEKNVRQAIERGIHTLSGLLKNYF